MNILKPIALIVTLTCLSLPAQAMTWSLQNVIFEDEGTATGSFVYDAAANSYSDIMLTTTVGTILPGMGYSAIQAGSNTTVRFANGLNVLQLAFVAALTDAGGTIALGAGRDGRDPFEGICTGSAACREASSIRKIIGGSVTTEAAPLPEPGSLILLLIGLAGIAGFGRRKSI
jgi:hypothetical protein